MSPPGVDKSTLPSFEDEVHTTPPSDKPKPTSVKNLQRHSLYEYGSSSASFTPDDDLDQQKSTTGFSVWSVLFWCTGAIFGSVMQNVYLEECGRKMPIYSYFIFWSTTIPFCVVFFAALAVVHWRGEIGDGERGIPQYKWIIIGVLNMMNGLLLLNSNPHVPGAMQALLGPQVATIPLSMLVSLVMLRVRYRWTHVLSVLVIMGGIFVALYPSIFQSGVTEAGFSATAPPTAAVASSLSLPPPTSTTTSSSSSSMSLWEGSLGVEESDNNSGGGGGGMGLYASLVQPIATMVYLGASGEVMSVLGTLSFPATVNASAGELIVSLYANATAGGGPGTLLFSGSVSVATPSASPNHPSSSSFFSSFSPSRSTTPSSSASTLSPTSSSSSAWVAVPYEMDLPNPLGCGAFFYVGLNYTASTGTLPAVEVACTPTTGSADSSYWYWSNSMEMWMPQMSSSSNGSMAVSACTSSYIEIQANGIDEGSASWNLLWFCGSIPLVFSSVYEERVFGQEHVHVLYMLAWTTLYQSLSIYATFWVDAIPNFGSSDNVHDIFTNQWNAIQCVFGHQISACPECVCSQAWWNWVLFTIGYLIANFFMLGVIKYCGATFYYVVSAISVPLTTFAFSWKALLGPDAESLNNYVYYALGVLLLGIILYRLSGQPGKATEATTDNRPSALDVPSP